MTMAPRDERGFVLSLVIFAVAALSIAGTALFLVVQSESAMANSGAESSNAFHLANAGLSRYMGEVFGTPPAERTYEMGGGTVRVTARQLMAQGDTSVTYLIRSAAEVRDRRVRDLVSRRTVQQYATLRRRPFKPIAGLTLAGTHAKTRNVTLDGRDQCASGTGSVPSIATLGNADLRGSINGPPATYASYEQMMTDIGLDWNAMIDPAYRFQYEVPEQSWPGFSLGRIPAGVFPTIRYRGDLRATSALSGRGLLVVTGDITFENGFTWDGAILAGGINAGNASFTVNGALLTGFAGQENRSDLHNATIRYNSCNVTQAAAGAALLFPVANTWWESAE